MNYSRRLTPQPALLYPLQVDYNQTLIDRLRANTLADSVEVVSHQPEAQSPPLVTRTQLSAQWVPPALQKLQLTLMYLQDILRARAPRSLRTACLLSKPSRRVVDVKVDYIGFTIEDRFVVGYGLDYAEKYRNLGHIAVLNSAISPS